MDVIPAGFQYAADRSETLAPTAPPMPCARAPTPRVRNSFEYFAWPERNGRPSRKNMKSEKDCFISAGKDSETRTFKILDLKKNFSA